MGCALEPLSNKRVLSSDFELLTAIPNAPPYCDEWLQSCSMGRFTLQQRDIVIISQT